MYELVQQLHGNNGEKITTLQKNGDEGRKNRMARVASDHTLLLTIPATLLKGGRGRQDSFLIKNWLSAARPIIRLMPLTPADGQLHKIDQAPDHDTIRTGRWVGDTGVTEGRAALLGILRKDGVSDGVRRRVPLFNWAVKLKLWAPTMQALSSAIPEP